MNELKKLKSNIKPHEILLVVDSMTGQDAVNVSEKFNEAIRNRWCCINKARW